MAKHPEDRRFFTTTEVARYCEVSNDGILKWIKTGKLRAFATPGGHYRVSAEDFREFLTLYAFPIQESFFKIPEDNPRDTRVLIVQGDATQRSSLVRNLRSLAPHWIVDEAGDGYEAGIKIGTTRPDLVLLDTRMPQVDGASLCRSIRSNPETSKIRIIAVRGEGHESLTDADAELSLSGQLEIERVHLELARLLGEPARRKTRPRQQM